MGANSVIYCIVAFIGAILGATWSFFKSSERKRLEELTTRKQHERREEFQRLRSSYPLGTEQRKIVALNWEHLVGKLQRRELSAQHVLEAYIAKALEVSDRCNPLTNFIHQAHIWAKELDDMEEVKGPLHGVPFCVKDDTDVVGHDSTLGLARRLYKPATESAVIVKVLQDLGAIPFVKTNLPQTMFSYGSDNPIFGTTTNCHNRKWTPTGSSSGTGALVGGGGAIFGTGTDLGGSLRAPAHSNGVSSIKPTSARLSFKGIPSPIPKASIGLPATVGIIGQTPSIVSSVFEKMVQSGNHAAYDCLIPPVAWKSEAFESKVTLRIGYFESLPSFPPMGDSTEVLLRSRNALESLGHALIPFDMPDSSDLYRQIKWADKGQHLRNTWKNEKVATCLKMFWDITLIPVWLVRIIGKVFPLEFLRICAGRMTFFFTEDATTTHKFWEVMGERIEFRNQVLKQWENLHLDALICNILPFPALELGSHASTDPSPYAVIFNLLDFPAGVVTMGTESGKKFNHFDEKWEISRKMAHQAMQGSIGAPIGIQVAGKPWQEETVLRIMKELEAFNTFKRK